MVSITLVPIALLTLQLATAQTTAGLRTPVRPPEPRQEVTPELRGDIMMARKMYREAVDFYKVGADKSPTLANKTGIAYHQLLDMENAKRWYQRAIKLNPQYPEAQNNLGTIYYAQKSYKRAID